MTATPAQEWWTAAEIAAAGLPGLPGSKFGVNLLADRLTWRAQPGLARRRTGRGGGWEYSWRLLPEAAQTALLRAAPAPAAPVEPVPEAEPAPAPLSRDEAWAWFERLPEAVQGRARARLLTIQKVEALERGMGRFLAVHEVARLEGVAPRTVWAWLALVEGVRVDDRLAYLAPRHRAAPRRRAKVHCDPSFMDLVKSDYLRLAQPSFTSAYRRAVRIAAAQDWATLPERTMRRRLEAEVSVMTRVLLRKGVEALKAYYPAQTRDKSALAPLEVVNADFHKYDVFVEWPIEPGQDKPYVGRPQMVAFQDVFSGRILAWRVDQTPNRVAVALAAGDMIEAWGIPGHVLMDNGREFAAKALTGGAPTRYRFKVRDTDPPGLFVALGCEIHWATPYSGQSKPIERAFRDLCDSIAKDPRFDGAWTGNRPDAKPEDYGSRAVPLEQFLRVVAEGIEEHNTRQGRRSEVAHGRSFADVFDEAYARVPIRRATQEQRRLWLLGAEGVRAQARSGLIRFLDNEYWAPWMGEIAGEPVVIRFDPADLWDAGLHVYDAEGLYLGHAPIKARGQFLSLDEARIHAKARREWMRREKDAAAAHRRFAAVDLGGLLDATAPAPAAPVEAKVVRATFGAPDARRARPIPTPEADVVLDAVMQGIAADISFRAALEDKAETEVDRFRRALELERAAARGDPLADDQRHWLGRYRETAEYRAQRVIHDDFGDAMFG